MENMELQRVEAFRYWPHDRNIPVLSESTMNKLKEANILEISKDNWEEDMLNINIDGVQSGMPRMLTSRAALVFLGLTVAQAEKLWKILLKVSSPPVIPNVENGGQWAFWMGVKLWMCDEISEVPGYFQKDQEVSWTNKLLDRAGITKLCREQELKVIRGGETVITCLQDQKPKDVLYLVKKYIDHRWQLLAKMESVLARDDPSEWWPRFSREMTKSPIDFQAVYTSDGSEVLTDIREFLPATDSSGQAQW